MVNDIHNNRILSAFLVTVFFLLLLSGSGLASGAFLNLFSAPRLFGATYMNMDNPYFDAVNDSLEEVITANGDVLITRDGAYDQLKQNEQILDMIEQGCSAIFVNPVDQDLVESALIECEKAGIPVFDVDTEVSERSLVTSTIISDNYDAGVQIARDIMKKRAAARIAIIYDARINSTVMRVRGFKDAIKNEDSYHIVAVDTSTSVLEQSMKITEKMLDDGVKFDAALGANDPTALGMLSALQLKGINWPMIIYGIDGSPDFKAMIRQGQVMGTSAQFPKEVGRRAAETAYDYLNGRTVPQKVVIPVKLITKENLSDYDINGWQ